LFVQDGELKHPYAFLEFSSYHQESKGRAPDRGCDRRDEFRQGRAKTSHTGDCHKIVGQRRPVGQPACWIKRAGLIFSGMGMDVGGTNGLVVESKLRDKGRAFASQARSRRVGLRRSTFPHLTTPTSTPPRASIAGGQRTEGTVFCLS